MIDVQTLMTIIAMLIGIDMTILSFVVKTKNDINKLRIEMLNEMRKIEHRLTRLETYVFNGDKS